LSREKSIFSAIFGGFFADFRLYFSNLKYARDCRRRRLHPSQADELGSTTIPPKVWACAPEGVERAIADFVCFHAPSSRPQTRNPLQQEKSSHIESENYEKSAKKAACLRAFAKNRRLQKSNQANAIIPESHAAAH
jgi:hypothetical protein